MKELINMKIVKEGLDKQIEDMKKQLQDRIKKYNEMYAWKEKRKNEKETLRRQLSDLSKTRESEGKKI